MMKFKYIILLLCILPVFSACDQKDDVLDIFTNRTWKLTGFFRDGKPAMNKIFANSSEDEIKTIQAKLHSDNNYCFMTFSGIEVEQRVEGEYNGYASARAIQGKWEANGENNAFRISNQPDPANSEDVVGRAFIKALQQANKYHGNTVGDLTIYYGDDKEYILLRSINK